MSVKEKPGLEESKARYLDFEGRRVGAEGSPCEGVYEVDGALLRFRDGFLSGGGEAAVSFPDGHSEWWEAGTLHRGEGLPAVVSLGGSWEEYWEHGAFLRVVFFGGGEEPGGGENEV